MRWCFSHFPRRSSSAFLLFLASLKHQRQNFPLLTLIKFIEVKNIVWQLPKEVFVWTHCALGLEVAGKTRCLICVADLLRTFFNLCSSWRSLEALTEIYVSWINTLQTHRCRRNKIDHGFIFRTGFATDAQELNGVLIFIFPSFFNQQNYVKEFFFHFSKFCQLLYYSKHALI